MSTWITHVHGSMYTAGSVGELIEILTAIFDGERVHPIGSSNSIKTPAGVVHVEEH